MRLRVFLAVEIYFLLLAYLSGQDSPCNARNVILMIGDGMGLAQVSYLAYSLDEPMAVESFPVVGLQKTHSASNIITDSGAAGSAMSCGVKTYNSSVGMNSDTLCVPNLVELCHRKNMRTGVVVTSSLVHATPAAFIAHCALRGFHEAIAADLVTQHLSYFAGGGKMYFDERYNDHRNLVQELKDSGYVISSYDKRSFHAFASKVEPRMGYFSAHAEPLPHAQGREDLSEMVTHALQVLSAGDQGFFLMIEGSQIDFACHANDPGYLLSELKDMDGGVRAALEFASKRDDTLLIVTADHESGGLILKDSRPDKKVNVEFLSHHHTPVMVPVFAYGACARMFAGVYENTEIFNKIHDILGLD